jgi:hypothetical protein
LIESGNVFLDKGSPEEAARDFRKAREIWRSTEIGGAAAFVTIHIGLTNCALQMTYKASLFKDQIRCLETAQRYNEQAREKVLESNDSRGVPTLMLDQFILMARRAQLDSDDKKIDQEQAKELLQQLKPVVEDIKLLARRKYTGANTTLGRAEYWLELLREFAQQGTRLLSNS